jgi:peptidyl-prolyl cis-trans isomerase SurA
MWLALLLLACGDLPPPPKAPSPSEVVEAVQEPEPSEAIEELPAPTEARYAASHILIAFDGAVHAPEGVGRTDQRASDLATEVRQRAIAGDPFTELAKLHSDGPSKTRSGHLGVYQTGTMMPAFERAVASVEPGAIGPVVKTPFGYHVVRREPIVEVRVSHILIPFNGSWRAATETSREDALIELKKAKLRLTGGEDFAVVAKEVSADPSASQGGDLGRFGRGQMVPAFEDAAFSLRVGQTSAVIETPYGLHILMRTE